LQTGGSGRIEPFLRPEKSYERLTKDRGDGTAFRPDIAKGRNIGARAEVRKTPWKSHFDAWIVVYLYVDV